jgi:hypothetical protein
MANALAMERRVEIYDWGTPSPTPSPSPRRRRRRSRRTASPSPSSELGWRAQPIPDHAHHELASFAGPKSARFLPGGTLRLGAFVIDGIGLPPELREATVALTLAPDVLRLLPQPLRQRARLSQGRIHLGDPAAPAAGDFRIGYFVTPAPREVTVVARQTDGRLAPHVLADGAPVAIIKPERLAARDVLQQEAVAAEAGIGAGYIFSLPLFAMGVFLAYFPLHAAGRVLPGLRVVGEPGLFAFLLLGTAAVSLGAGAYARWSAGAPGAGWSAAAAAAALGTLVVLGVRRLERDRYQLSLEPPPPPE